MKRFILLLITLFAMTNVMAQLQPDMPIPADKEVRVGRLENGMTYYIRHNEKPKGQASFYIFHHVGAVQEEDSQQGLAHFLEHMAFNGTKNLPGKKMIEYLERNGVKFGADLNAYTSYDETCYNLDNVPTANPATIDTALLILHDWSQFISLEPQEINNERGVIMEELRTRDGAGWRAMVRRNAAVNRGSKYEHRNVIGYLDGLKSFDHQDLYDFYKTWYRPEYQAIVVVGDIDVDRIENKIKTLMADIPVSPADAPQKEAYLVPDNEEPIVSILADPETTASVMRLFIKRPAFPKQYNNLVVRQMSDVLNSYVLAMAINRMNEIAMQPDAPFLGATMDIGDILMLNPNMDLTMIAVQTRDGELLRGYKAILEEMEKMKRYGFTQSEFDRTKAEFLRQTEATYANRNDRTNGQFVQTYLANYKKNTAMADAETQYNLDKQYLEALTLDDVNTWVKQLLTPENQVITVEVPKKEGLTEPTEAELLAIRSEVMASDVEAYQDNTVSEPLIPADIKLKGSPVKKTAYNEDLGTTEWILKNGVKIIVKPTQLKADEVLMVATADGGTSLLPTSEVKEGEFLPIIAAQSGVGKFSAIELNKQLAGKKAGVELNVNNYSNGMSGYCSPKDIETMLQLLYQNFTSPRFSEEDFNTTMNSYKAYVQNLTSNPDYIMSIETIKTLYSDNPRQQPLTIEALESISFENLPKTFKTLYPGANSFTFTFVGNVDLETLKPLVEKYIGSIPTSKHVIKFTDDKLRTAKGKVMNDFRTPMLQPKVSEFLLFSSDADYTLRNKQTMLLLNMALNNRYLKSIREEKGGTYGVQVSYTLSYRPEKQALLQIQFDTNEEMADELVPIVFDEFEKIATEGPEAKDINDSREYLVKQFKNTLENNGTWFGLIDDYNRHKQNLLADYEKTLNSITYDEIRDLAKKLLDSGNVIQVTMRPEAQPETDE
uniref:M16 family metallopeptidase n=1 Tax=Alistipes putredinis TaxID=28117 RepID=UPI003FD82FB2